MKIKVQGIDYTTGQDNPETVLFLEEVDTLRDFPSRISIERMLHGQKIDVIYYHPSITLDKLKPILDQVDAFVKLGVMLYPSYAD